MKIILKKPLDSEKTRTMLDEGKYVFIVDKKANKVEIAKEIEKKFGVNVVGVNTINYEGKKKVRYTKSGIFKGKTPSFKKAIITLAEGEIIDVYKDIT